MRSSTPLAFTWQGSRLRGAPGRLVVALLSVELVALVLGAWALFTVELSSDSWKRLAILFTLAVIFEELSRQVVKQRLLISSGPQPDMTSVWTFGGVLILPPASAALLAVLLAAYIWLRQRRTTARPLYRRVYSGSTIVLACLAASAVLRHVGDNPTPSPSAHPALVVAAALVVYTCVNRFLISVAVVLAGGGVKRSMVLGKWDDNALELATLCLGYVAALVVINQPLMTVVVLVPMVLLQRGALVKQLEEMSTIDAKTQLLNALAWQQLAARALARAGRTSSAAILVIDLDHFKSVNDVHGHLVGDAALYQVGQSIKQELRQADLVGRFGGEEFVVMLPDLGAEAGTLIAERVRSRIATILLSDLQGQHTDGGVCVHALSASIGVAMFPDHATDLSGLLRAADAALYAAKHAGRNRIALAGHERPESTSVPLPG
ncbi:MAG: GGDEF domain-containing protein [Pseudonocardiales bacterium]